MTNPWDQKHWGGKTARMRAYHDRVEDDIERHGRHVVCVAPTQAEASSDLNDRFSYTIGNARKGLPELLVVGVCKDAWILNPLSEIMLERGHKFADGETVSLDGGRFPVCLIDAAETVKDDYTVQAGEHYDTGDYAVMQVVMPDPGGLFPWQSECVPPHSRIVVHRRAAA